MKFMSLNAVLRWLPLAKQLGVSTVARSPRGFLTAYKKAGSPAKLSEYWRKRRAAFIARHMAQLKKRKEPLWVLRRSGAGKELVPSRRHLALIMWAYSPSSSVKKNPDDLLRRLERKAATSNAPGDILAYWQAALRANILPKATIDLAVVEIWSPAVDLLQDAPRVSRVKDTFTVRYYPAGGILPTQTIFSNTKKNSLEATKELLRRLIEEA